MIGGLALTTFCCINKYTNDMEILIINCDQKSSWQGQNCSIRSSRVVKKYIECLFNMVLDFGDWVAAYGDPVHVLSIRRRASRHIIIRNVRNGEYVG